MLRRPQEALKGSLHLGDTWLEWSSNPCPPPLPVSCPQLKHSCRRFIHSVTPVVHSPFFAGWEERHGLPVGEPCNPWSVCGTVSRSIKSKHHHTVFVCVCVSLSSQCTRSVLTGTCCHCHNGSVTLSTNATDDLRLIVPLIQESKRWGTCVFSACVCFIYSECVFVHTSVSPALRQTSRTS